MITVYGLKEVLAPRLQDIDEVIYNCLTCNSFFMFR